jgi:phage baseplate assembly protein W
MSNYSINLDDRDNYVVGIDDIKQSWGIILSTVPGSIPLLPEFGSDLYSYIDKPVNSVFSSLANTIIKDLERWEKRATISKVEKTINISQIIIKIFGIYKLTKEDVIENIVISPIAGDGIGYMIIGETFIIN